MRLVRLNKHAGSFSGIVYCNVSTGLNPLHFSELGRQYYAAVAGAEFSDHTFMLEDGGMPVALVECDVSTGRLGRFGAPLEIRFRPDAAYGLRKLALRQVMVEFSRLQTEAGFDGVDVISSAESDPDGLILGACLGAGSAPRQVFHSEIDLSLEEKAIVGDFRSGHRQQMRWGEKNLELKYVDRENPDRNLFECFRDFHAVIAGRVTRGAESWDIMFAFLASGQADLVTGFLDGKMVSATMVMDAAGTAVYASGVYDRSRFDLPLAHYPLTAAIFRARRRGARWFDIGEGYYTGDNAKMASISYFKRGFSSRLRAKNNWQLDFRPRLTEQPADSVAE